MASFYLEKLNAPTVQHIHEKCLLPEERDRSAQHSLLTRSPPCPTELWTRHSHYDQPKLKEQEHLHMFLKWFQDGFLKYNSGKTPSRVREMAILTLPLIRTEN